MPLNIYYKKSVKIAIRYKANTENNINQYAKIIQITLIFPFSFFFFELRGIYIINAVVF